VFVLGFSWGICRILRYYLEIDCEYKVTFLSSFLVMVKKKKKVMVILFVFWWFSLGF
jgi:hypothetical protein